MDSSEFYKNIRDNLRKAVAEITGGKMVNNQDYTILVVDDDRGTRDLLLEILKEYTVITAENGEEALERVKNTDERPDLILLDVVMPGGRNGYEVCKRLKADEDIQDIPVIFLTVKADAEEEAQGLELGAVDYIHKPINSRIVKARVKNYLELRTHQLNEQIVAHIQKTMLPEKFRPLPHQSNLDLFAKMAPTKKVGGDFYDFFFIGLEKLAFVIGDVEGKGVPAALFLAVCLTLLRAEITKTGYVDICLGNVNNLLILQCPLYKSVVVFIGILDVYTGEVKHACGGHDLPYLLNPKGEAEKLPGPGSDNDGRALGKLEDQEYKAGKIMLNKGEALFLYTDGVTRATKKGGDMFGKERLIQYLEKNSQKSPEELSKGVIQEIEQFTTGEPQSDDITVMALRYN